MRKYKNKKQNKQDSLNAQIQIQKQKNRRQPKCANTKTKSRRQSKCANPQPGAFLCHSRTPTHLNTYEAGGNCKTNAPFTYLTFIIIPIRRSEKTTLTGHRDVRRSCWKKLVKDRCTQSNALNERERTKPCREVSTCSNGWVMEWGRRGGCCWGG